MSPRGVFGTASVKAIAGQCPSLTRSCGAGDDPRTQEEGAGTAGDGEIWAESSWSRAATSAGISVCFNAGNSCLANHCCSGGHQDDGMVLEVHEGQLDTGSTSRLCL